MLIIINRVVTLVHSIKPAALLLPCSLNFKKNSYFLLELTCGHMHSSRATLRLIKAGPIGKEKNNTLS